MAAEHGAEDHGSPGADRTAGAVRLPPGVEEDSHEGDEVVEPAACGLQSRPREERVRPVSFSFYCISSPFISFWLLLSTKILDL
jgi:hypothetical protein